MKFSGAYQPQPAFLANGDFDAVLDRHQVSLAPLPEGLPVRTIPVGGRNSFYGVCERPPWQYDVTVAIPTLNAPDRLELVIALLRLQTVKPFIVVIDTGSTPENLSRIEAMRAQDLEVHTLRLNGVSHSSEPVAMAMDFALATIRTRFLFCTHDDCFLMSPLALQYFRDICHRHPLVGHQMTRRPHDDWSEMAGHSAMMLDADFLLDHGITWNMRRAMRLFGLQDAMTHKDRPNWPDTELAINYLFQSLGVKPFFTGTEKNWTRNRDGLIDHCRSAGSNEVYDAERAKSTTAMWLKDAMREGWERVRQWSALELPAALPAPAKPIKRKRKLPTFTLGAF